MCWGVSREVVFDCSFKWRLNISALLANYRKYIGTFPAVNGAKFDGPVLFVGGEKSDFMP